MRKSKGIYLKLKHKTELLGYNIVVKLVPTYKIKQSRTIVVEKVY